MFWIQEGESSRRLYRSLADERDDNPAGAIEFQDGIQQWIGLDYTKPDDSNTGCVALGPFLTEEEAEDAVEKSVAC